MEFKTVLAIRGHHIYKSIREPETERYSQLKMEDTNSHNQFVVAVMDKVTATSLERFRRPC